MILTFDFDFEILNPHILFKMNIEGFILKHTIASPTSSS